MKCVPYNDKDNKKGGVVVKLIKIPEEHYQTVNVNVYLVNLNSL